MRQRANKKKTRRDFRWPVNRKSKWHRYRHVNIHFPNDKAIQSKFEQPSIRVTRGFLIDGRKRRRRSDMKQNATPNWSRRGAARLIHGLVSGKYIKNKSAMREVCEVMEHEMKGISSERPVFETRDFSEKSLNAR